MVCAAVHRLGYAPKPCLAKPMLFAALECLDRGDVIGAGVRLREAVYRFVRHACDWYGIEVKGKYPRARDYALALHNAKCLDKWGWQIVLEIIETGNKSAHLQSVKQGHVKSGIELLFSLMDSEPYCGHDREPIATSHKPSDVIEWDDDDDDADGWKAGVQ